MKIGDSVQRTVAAIVGKGVSTRVGVALALCLSIAGCTIHRPPDYNSPAVAAVCSSADGETVTVKFKEQTRQVTVDFVPSWEELYDLCGETGGACVNLETNEIHMVADRRCEQHASHELAHVFGVPGVDVERQIAARREAFLNRR